MLIFIYGEDQFRSQIRLNELKKTFLAKYGQGAGFILLDAGEEGSNEVEIITKLKENINSSGLFSEKKLIILKEIINQTKKEAQDNILEILENKKNIASDKDNILIFWEPNQPRKNNKLFKFLTKTSKNETFPKLESYNLTKWIKEHLNQLNPQIQIEHQALSLLSAYVGDDMARLDQELQKIVSYCAKGASASGGKKDTISKLTKQPKNINLSENNNIITPEDIKLLVNAKVNSNIFEAIEALGSGNKPKALKLLSEQLQKGEDPFYILSMYAYQLRTLLKISDFQEKGLFNQYQIAKQAKLHPFVVQKSLPQLRNFSLKKLKTIYKNLSQLDIKVKTGEIDILMALNLFIAKI